MPRQCQLCLTSPHGNAGLLPAQQGSASWNNNDCECAACAKPVTAALPDPPTRQNTLEQDQDACTMCFNTSALALLYKGTALPHKAHTLLDFNFP
eukprot:1159724-Pelagomonas_calceolata.AAC.1